MCENCVRLGVPDGYGHDANATPSEARREFAYNAGADYPDRAWLLTDWDTWESNPHYQGPPVPHPEFAD